MIMKHTRKLALSAVIAAAISSGASANNPAVEIHVDGGRYFFEDTLNDADTWGVGVGFGLGENWMIDLVASQWDSEVSALGDDGDVDGIQYRADMLYHITTESKWRPYVAFGVGDQDRDFTNTDLSERDTLVNLGAGLKRELGNNWQFRTDIRAFNSLDNEYTDLAVTAGIALVFGNEEPAPAPVVVAPVDGDSDGDGVSDSKDKCPDTVSGLKVDEVGCPVILDKTLEINLDILFDTAKSDIKDEYMWQVKKLADAMTQYINTVVHIEGHTDSQGSDALNQKLSQSRADSVKAALITKFGIAADRVTATGHGEAKPIADNTTAEGRAQNRRVVGSVSVKYTEAEKK
jgi:OOP family OmpA-OmpF porin